MSTGCMVQELNPNKLELTGIIGDSTYIDVLVDEAQRQEEVRLAARPTRV